MKLDLTKLLQTHNGCKVRLLCDDGPGPYPLVGLVEGVEFPVTWQPDGKLVEGWGQHPQDLINVPVRHTVDGFLNIYPIGRPFFHFTKEAANQSATPGRIACIPISITYTDGEGL